MARGELSSTAIRRAALALVDEQGYPALTMRNLGARLGVKAASLYYHVPHRAALLRLIADGIAIDALPLGPAGTPDTAAAGPDRDWRALLRHWAERLRRTLAEHPGAAVIVATQDVSPQIWQPIVPPLLARLQAGLDVTEQTALFLVQSLYVLVTGLALAQFGEAPDPPPAPPEYYDAWFAVAVDTFLDGVAVRHSRPPGG